MDTRLAAYIATLPALCGQDRADPLAGTALPAISFWQQLRGAGLMWRLGALVAAHTIETALLLASWAFLGYGALSGRLDAGWLTAWALCLASTVPLRVAARWLEGVIAVGFGGLLKQRLLAGATRIEVDLMRRKGAGELLGEVLETEAIERLGTNGGLETLLGGARTPPGSDRTRLGRGGWSRNRFAGGLDCPLPGPDRRQHAPALRLDETSASPDAPVSRKNDGASHAPGAAAAVGVAP